MLPLVEDWRSVALLAARVEPDDTETQTSTARENETAVCYHRGARQHSSRWRTRCQIKRIATHNCQADKRRRGNSWRIECWAATRQNPRVIVDRLPGIDTTGSSGRPLFATVGIDADAHLPAFDQI
jgi:hypothetical protein